MRIIRKPLKVTPRKKLRPQRSDLLRNTRKKTTLPRSQTSNYRGPSSSFCCFTLSRWAESLPSVRLRIIKPGVPTGKAEPRQPKAYRGTGQRVARNQGRQINPAGKTVPADVQKLVDSSHASGGSGAKSQSNLRARKGPANPRKSTWSKKEIVPPGSPRNSKLVTRTC